MASDPCPTPNHEGGRALPAAVLYYGGDQLLSRPLKLKAGPVSMRLETDEAFLRHLRLDGHEMIRGVYVAVRDRNWYTIPPVVSRLTTTVEADCFEATFEVLCRRGKIDFEWKGTVRGTAEGRVRFTMEGVARSTFWANRIGLCLLHPIRECAGRECVVEKVDGTTETGVFPKYISPHQPFTGIRAIRHEIVRGLSARVEFTGDVFEMEDQRNWTDASYKTYCPPLARPYPSEIPEGTIISQSVTINLDGRVPARTLSVPAGAPTVVLASEDRPPVRLPGIGLACARHGPAPSAVELERLRALSLSHLRVDLDLTSPDWLTSLARAADQAVAMGCPLEVALFLTRPAEELAMFAEAVGSLKPPVVRWLVFRRGRKVACAECLELARRLLPINHPGAMIGSGTDANFAELNRGWPLAAPVDFVCWSMHPQVHAFDNTSLVETLEGQGYTVLSARRLAGGLPLVVSPITLGPRFNPYAADAARGVEPASGPPAADIRQISLFGAGWTLGSLKYLSENGIDSATYFETTGRQGVLAGGSGCPPPPWFPSRPDGVFPLYHVFADLGEFAPGEVMPCVSTEPLSVCGLILRKHDRSRVMLANLTPDRRSVLVRSGVKSACVKRLDETTAETAMSSPERFREQVGEVIRAGRDGVALELRPHALVRLDVMEDWGA